MGPESGALNIVNADDGSMLLNISGRRPLLCEGISNPGTHPYRRTRRRQRRQRFRSGQF